MNAASAQRRCKQVVLPQFRRPVRRKSLDTYRCADDKDVVVDLLLRVTTVSVETMAIVEAMRVKGR